MMRDVLREEKKFLMLQAEALALRAHLSGVLTQDANNGIDGYCVRSLYFDTLRNRDLQEKEDGIELRRKLRLRVYSPDADFALLEMKQKQGVQQRKRSLRLSKGDAQRLIAGDYSPLLRYSDPFAAECYALMQTRCYRPRTVIEYRRLAFAAKENNIRITFDHRIEATSAHYDIFDPKLLMTPVLDPSQAVLEVKFNGFLLSYIKDCLNTVDKSELSVSKYALARQQSYFDSL